MRTLLKQNCERHICAATATLPLQLIVLVLDISPGEPGHPLEVVTGLRCSLEKHSAGLHFDLVRELNDARQGEVWVRWAEGQVPECVAVLPDCPDDNGEEGAANEACTLFRDHPGGHSFEYSDPEYDAVRASPDYDQLTAEINDRLKEEIPENECGS
ncbi:hypothetical protein ACWF94_17495 [Streptomyces sp. NPDC055078]